MSGKVGVVRIVLLLMAMAITVTGCQSGIPRSGAVYVGERENITAEQPVIFNPDGPAQGASPEEIVRGFVRAATSSTGDYAVAREFLTTSFSPQWNPYAGVIIDSGERGWRGENNQITMMLTPVSTVNSHGTMRFSPSEQTVEQVFTLLREAGEWRVSSAPEGIVLDERTFSEVFNEHSLYFIDPLTEVLVPDQRWFLRGATIATRIVTELLSGPSDLLANNVTTTAFPSGTVLTSSVPISGNNARVDLSREALGADDRQLQLMLAQIESSLQDVAGITRAEIMVGQVGLLSGPTDPALVTRYPRVHNNPFILKSGALVLVNSEQTDLHNRFGTAVAQMEPEALVVPSGKEFVVVKNAGGISLVTEQGTTPVDTRPGLINPVVDPHGFVWSVPRDSPLSLAIAPTRGVATGAMQATWTDASSIELMSISLDGTRLVTVYSRGGSYVVAAVGVVRNQEGAPTALTEPIEIQRLTETPIDLDWVDENSVAVASGDQVSGYSLGIVSMGGNDQQPVAPQSIASLAGANSISQLRILGRNGELLEYRNPGWQAVTSGVTLLAKQAYLFFNIDTPPSTGG
ncbi:LpqB family beta-propeller domain-containing protein [Lysinibacter sp. HNR]|uniref:LpqB family beta-propeller domain-containing protein n=1 Tax=Lysinibacter sp. HNR TaxID=3031408 RepID=UPI002435F4F6|nr:LpqB family beta-propeller domain-containing protein [Lysinibacter sp. HNR]WGD38038.1 LpqB family beta-propeller domain-containing protein [Lysinibacter sp. HNR]